jgi:hypothetical protein
LTGYSGVTLSFWHTYDLEPGYDYGYVEYSTDGGVTWQTATTFNGWSHTTWEQAFVSIPGLDDITNARIRFRLETDSSVTGDGWHIDDIILTGGGSACSSPTAPTAEFSSNSPVFLGQPLQFTDLSSGTPPFTYLWDFGDGIGTSDEANPAYTYATTGTYTVALTVTNDLGSNSVTHPVSIVPCIALSGLDLTLVTSGTLYTGEPVEFSTDLLPDDASFPYSYLVDFGTAAFTRDQAALILILSPTIYLAG